MRTRRLLFCAFLLACCWVNAQPIEPTSLTEVRWTDGPPGATSATLVLNRAAGRTTLTLTRAGELARWTLRNPQGKLISLGNTELIGQHLMAAGVLFVRDDAEGVFLAFTSGGTGWHENLLLAMAPDFQDAAFLEMGFPHAWTRLLPDISRSAPHDAMKAEQEFLEKAKWAFGYLDHASIIADARNPRYAYYLWAYDRQHGVDGKVREYPADALLSRSSVTDQCQMGDTEYTAYFKAGVVAKNHATEKSHVVFHPESMYCWPTVLLPYHNMLFIGTRGEGLFIHDPTRNKLHKVDALHDVGDVESIEVRDDELVVNATQTLPLQSVLRK